MSLPLLQNGGTFKECTESVEVKELCNTARVAFFNCKRGQVSIDCSGVVFHSAKLRRRHYSVVLTAGYAKSDPREPLRLVSEEVAHKRVLYC